MSTVAIIGAQWGDEGKGKVVDYLAQRAAMVIRFQGGNNAGHTVVNDLGTFAFHLLPCGILSPGTDNLLGPGTVVTPPALLEEMADVGNRADVSFERFWISERAHVVMPYHIALDAAEERARGDLIQGTTLRGIGPAYADKAGRCGLRMGDLLDADYLGDALPMVVDQKNRLLRAVFDAAPFDADELLEQCLAWAEEAGFRPHGTARIDLPPYHYGLALAK